MRTSVQYRKGLSVSPGTACLICGDAAILTDHCHAHGWVRGPLCNGCNVAMGYVDSWRVPERASHLAEALAAHVSRCPKCLPRTAATILAPPSEVTLSRGRRGNWIARDRTGVAVGCAPGTLSESEALARLQRSRQLSIR